MTNTEKWDLTGQRFDSFTVIERAPDKVRPNGKKRPVWLCRCDCGVEKLVESQNLHSKHRVSCVCFGNEPKPRDYSKKHGMYESREYSSYRHMKSRCYNPKEAGYEDYGDRGIEVSESWKENFINFFEDMGFCPEGWVLDRIDPEGNYCKENCRWIDRNTSSYNTRKAKNNTSGRTGVYWFDRVGKWTASISFDYKQIHLGYFVNFEDAVKAREDAEIKYYGVNKE